MSIAGTDLLFVKSETMTDAPDGGGRMGTSFVTAVENDVFPDVAPTERVTGAQHLRRLFAGAFSDDNDPLAFGQVGMSSRPTDANVDVYLMASPDSQNTTRRDNALGAVQGGAYLETYTLGAEGSAAMHAGTKTVTMAGVAVGDKITLVGAFGSQQGVYWASVTAYSSGVATLDIPSNWAFDHFATPFGYRRATYAGLGAEAYNRSYNLCGLALTTAGVSAGATSLTVDKLTVRVRAPGADALAAVAFSLRGMDGLRPLFFAGDRVLVQHASTSTREFAMIASVNYVTGALTFTAGLANAYTTGAKVCLPVDVGSLQAAASGLFSQQTWTRVFGTSAIGTPPTARYSGTVGVTNEGTITGRWAAVFTSTTTYQVISEHLGVIGSGNIATDYMPLNPLTSQPYFTLRASAWGTGWVNGNAFRWDTAAAAGAFWMTRYVAPSTAGGTEQATLFMRGDVNA